MKNWALKKHLPWDWGLAKAVDGIKEDWFIIEKEKECITRMRFYDTNALAYYEGYSLGNTGFFC